MIDKTGLTGLYDFHLTWTPLQASQDAIGPSLFTLTDQLGLKLASTKGRVTVYVIEKIERPTEN